MPVSAVNSAIMVMAGLSSESMEVTSYDADGVDNQVDRLDADERSISFIPINGTMIPPKP
jgi:hypothetical protein